MKFELGKVVQTQSIYFKCYKDEKFSKEVKDAFERYIKCDWGDLNESDKEMNDSAVENNNDRILARYNTSIKPIYIITEYDRSMTTILFRDEY